MRGTLKEEKVSSTRREKGLQDSVPSGGPVAQHSAYSLQRGHAGAEIAMRGSPKRNSEQNQPHPRQVNLTVQNADEPILSFGTGQGWGGVRYEKGCYYKPLERGVCMGALSGKSHRAAF